MSREQSRPVWQSIAILALLGSSSLACRAQAPSPVIATRSPHGSVEELVKLRCALDGQEVLTAWTGEVYAFVPDEAPRRLFAVTGMNIARCIRVGDGWHLTSRELMYYLDPATGRVLDRWHNPWTDETVPVVHVANRLVQNPLGPVAITRTQGRATLALDIPVFYPNPLAGDPATRAYSPQAHYVAAELFAFETSASDLDAPGRASVPAMTFTWHRVGPWLPWMNMGARPGQLVYSAHGRKLAAFAELPTSLREEISARLPLYRHAPRCIVDARNVTSWTYFAQHLAEYRAGARFPVASAENPAECVPPDPTRR